MYFPHKSGVGLRAINKGPHSQTCIEKNKGEKQNQKLIQRDFTRILCEDKQKTMVCF